MKYQITKQILFRSIFLSGLLAVAFAAAGFGQRQTTSVFTAGLSQPAKIMQTPLGNFLVTETLGPPNSGRVSIIDRSGNRRTLIDGLPSGIGIEGPSGPTGLDMRGRTLYVAIGEGDEVVAGPAQGTQVPNPSPSSPLLSSVLRIDFSAKVERFGRGFSLSPADQIVLANGGAVTLRNGTIDSITVSLLTDIPNTVPNPLPFFTGNVRQSNPFAVAVGGDSLYAADAGMNLVWKINLLSGERQVLTVFPPRRNPLPFGPPVIEAVPDGIRVVGDQLLVTLLTGFPFVPGLSEVRMVDTRTGENKPFISGRSSAIDVLADRSGQDGNNEERLEFVREQPQVFVLEFSANLLANEPGQLLLFRSSVFPQVIARGLISPTGMTRDESSGDIFITEIFTGRIIRVRLNQSVF